MCNSNGNSNGKANFPHKLLLTNTEVSRICKAFESGSLTNTKLSKTQLSKMMQLGGFLPLLGLPTPFNFLSPLATPLIKSAEKKLQKGVLTSGKDFKNLLVDGGVNALGAKIKKGISAITNSGITLTSNEI